VPENAAPASSAAHRLGNACGHGCGSAIDRTILQELKLSPAQNQRFRALLDGLDARFFPLRNQPHDEGGRRARAIVEEAATSLESLLTKAQVRRLAEIQVRLQGTGALLQDGLAKPMSYEPEQRAQLTKVISETLAATRDLEAQASKGEPREPLEKQYAALKREELEGCDRNPDARSAIRLAKGARPRL